MAIQPLGIFTFYDKQRFTQFGAMDCANFYKIEVESAKKKQALYPAMGRKHVNFFNENRLVYIHQPRFIFKSIDYLYVVVGTQLFQYDRFYNERLVGFVHNTGPIWWAVLPVGNVVYIMLTTNGKIFVITEDAGTINYEQATGTGVPTNPLYVAAFGNRFVVSDANTPDYFLSQVNLAGNSSTWFNVPGVPGGSLFNRASGRIGQFAVLHNQLYIMCDFTTDVWSNIPTQITVSGSTAEFPWKLNTSYNFDYGIADPLSLSIDFGRMVWLAKNSNGLVSFMASNGSQPQDISTQAINVLLEQSEAEEGQVNPFLNLDTDGFLYQYENTVFYRVSAGNYDDTQLLDPPDTSADSIEFNFETQTWARVIELNGSRCRIQKHTFFNNKHLVIIQKDNAVYEMAGNIYHNELRTPDTDPQATNAFTKYPMRYELVTTQIFLDDYAEFIDDYVEIDFVFGDRTFYRNNAPFDNTVFIVDETSTADVPVYLLTEDDAFIIEEGSNTPAFDDNHYNALFKPHIELFYSDDGGVTYEAADLREFSPLGEYRWRMRWYELSISRNRCYKLVCVSSAPIVILGAVRNTRRASGGAN
jgi:hypothetical protein